MLLRYCTYLDVCNQCILGFRLVISFHTLIIECKKLQFNVFSCVSFVSTFLERMCIIFEKKQKSCTCRLQLLLRLRANYGVNVIFYSAVDSSFVTDSCT